MTIAYDSLRDQGQNIAALEAMRTELSDGVNADEFNFAALLTQPSGMLPDVTDVVSEIVAYGPPEVVTSELQDMILDRTAYFGPGHTSFIESLTGETALRSAVDYADRALNMIQGH